MSATLSHRECERQCQRCLEWKHHSRFATTTPLNSTVKRFDSVCRACRSKERNERKNDDRPLAIIRQRAATAAHKAGVTSEFFMIQMNYRALVPWLRAFMTEEGICHACGHSFLNERDIQIEHCEPPRHRQDWARLHARNLRLSCGSCNKTKSHKPFAQWLDEEEDARLSNLKLKELEHRPEYRQSSLFESEGKL
jgi:hypothetical protein